MQKKRAEFIISGRVQGVGYRYFVFHHAVSLGLTGYVRNIYDGNVVVVAEGEEGQLELLHQQLKIGPSRSYVENIKVIFDEYKAEFSRFEIH
ncbi:MAG: acylphosphatase [Bacteroidota bacterium]